MNISRIGIFLGGMRCGSTVMVDYMRQHPEVCCHKKKDPHFFSWDENWKKGWEWYLDGWAHFDPTKHNIAFESSTHYTKFPLYPNTARNMADNTNDIRLLYGVRDPVARVESHLIHNAGKGYLNPNDSEERKRLIRQAINVSNYMLQLDRYERFFPPERIKVIELDCLRSDPVNTMKSVFGHFGIDTNVVVEPIQARPRKFKQVIEGVRLTNAEIAWVEDELAESNYLFRNKYNVELASERSRT